MALGTAAAGTTSQFNLNAEAVYTQSSTMSPEKAALILWAVKEIASKQSKEEAVDVVDTWLRLLKEQNIEDDDWIEEVRQGMYEYIEIIIRDRDNSATASE